MKINKTYAPLIPDQFTASDMNQVKDELENAILGSQTLNANDVNQLGKHIANASMTNDYFIDSGIADAYVLSITGNFKSPTQLFEGMKIRFKALHSNTGASTINVSGLGVKNIKRADGITALSANEIIEDYHTTLLYNGVDFMIDSNSVIETYKAVIGGNASVAGNMTTSSINTDSLQSKSLNHGIIAKNSAGINIFKISDSGSLDSYSSVRYVGTCAANSTFDFYIGRYMIGWIILHSTWGGATGYDAKIYTISGESFSSVISSPVFLGSSSVNSLSYVGYIDPYLGIRYAQKFRCTCGVLAGAEIYYKPFLSGEGDSILIPII